MNVRSGMSIGYLAWVPLMAGMLVLGRLPCPLLEPEEARYAEIPRQMLATGHFLTPILHEQPYYQKPPLLYWLVMASYRVFGVQDWAARLIPCAAALGLVAVTWMWARRRFGFRAGALSALVLCLAPIFIYRGPLLSMDSVLALWVLAALATAHEALAGATLQRGWWVVSAVACSLGILTKGPVALLLVIVPISALRWASPSSPRISWRAWLGFASVACAVAGPWFAVVATRDPEAAAAFFWFHNLQRYVAPFDHAQPLWFYFPGLLIGMLPWSLWLVPLIREQMRTRGALACGPSALVRLALVWCVLFFSLSGCKRPAYILPAIPLLAIELGTFLAARPRLRFVPAFGGATFALLLAGVLSCLPRYHGKFSLREQVVCQRERARALPVACYPRRWDSVSFYLDRQQVRVYSRSEKAVLFRDLQEQGQCLLFVKAAFLDELRCSLPEGLEFRPGGAPDGNVIPGILRASWHVARGK
jgi:4-amino-4-deoxy-L-arabinose transferase-like glycosyltransferase